MWCANAHFLTCIYRNSTLSLLHVLISQAHTRDISKFCAEHSEQLMACPGLLYQLGGHAVPSILGSLECTFQFSNVRPYKTKLTSCFTDSLYCVEIQFLFWVEGAAWHADYLTEQFLTCLSVHNDQTLYTWIR